MFNNHIPVVDIEGLRECVRCFTKKRSEDFGKDNLACHRCKKDDVKRFEILIKSEYCYPRIAGVSEEKCKLLLESFKKKSR